MKDLIKATAITLSIVITALFALAYFRPALATDLQEHYLSQDFSLEKIAQMQHQASLEWQQEHGDLQPDLTAETEKYLINYTALLQEKVNE
ncbi:hypothetical protein C3007_07030 [Avibacterium gallinarum]|uniref:Uncharacterized protein n=1 Tax=Avibacterium gallinarum TaxID=755 RepID=A0A379B1H4_AVIGA|nr:hypothetical protein [Avibacterium gallinarum]POY44065.1 hypothetical protein C3007_07030 [Avibacterium gallinarum]TDP29132.1 hypothetical protein EV689_10349 [Avibacterium gallinarum]SUB28440.1 Uncharacterised protein [Avibacterium gallinarum]